MGNNNNVQKFSQILIINQINQNIQNNSRIKLKEFFHCGNECAA